MGYGFQMSKRRNNKKPAPIKNQDRVNGMKRNTMSWPITSSTTALGESVSPSNSIERVAAQMPTRMKAANATKIAAWIIATAASGGAVLGAYRYEANAFESKA